jgi:hypothetical protein
MNISNEAATLDKQVRYRIYDYVMRQGLIPTLTQTSDALGWSNEETAASFQRLADAHMLVLQKGTGEILMANPFSAVPTPFPVKVGERLYYGNCIWDAMGIPAMLKDDGVIDASCGCCGTAMSLKVANGRLERSEGVAHFAIPAAHWWDDIVFN